MDKGDYAALKINLIYCELLFQKFCLFVSFSLFFTVLIGACLSNVLLMKRKKVSKPRFISLFSVTNDQSKSRNSVLNASSLKFL